MPCQLNKVILTTEQPWSLFKRWIWTSF